MRIFAFTDLHGSTKALSVVKEEVLREKPDVVVCLGDLTIFEHELKPLLSRVNMLRTPVLMLHGNHEEEVSMRTVCDEFERITFLHREVVTLNGWTFVAYGGGGFSEHYPELERLAKSEKWRTIDWERTVFLSHAPPHGTTLDSVGHGHVGSRTLTKLIKTHKPRLVLAGHIHECFNATDMIGRTHIANPGPTGKHFNLEKL
jgi:uncharacterized protein